MSVAAGGAAGCTPSVPEGANTSPLGPVRLLPAPASVDVTVVEETCREPDDLLPLPEPGIFEFYFKYFII